MDRDNRIVIPLNTMLKRMLNQTYITMMRIKFAPGTDMTTAAGEISTILRYNHKLTVQGLPDDFTIITPDQVMEFLNRINSTLNIFLVVSTIVSIIIGSVVVSNIMQASISEREKEIALRRAFGATKSLIVIQVFLEIFFISIIGSVFGATLGAILGIIMGHFTGINVSISPVLFLVAFSVSTIIALIAGIQPAIKASSYDPAVVLQR
jgi:putative ABC transport system permease protein